MTIDANEAKDGGVLRDQYGRPQMIAVEKHAAPSVTAIPAPNGYQDADGREQVVITLPSGASLPSVESNSALKAVLPINASDYQTAGVSDETALLLAAAAANAAGRGLFIPRRAAEWVTSVPIPWLASGELFGNGTVIRQSTWRKPVFDLEATNDIYVHDFYLRSTATRTNGTGSFRGDDEDRYGAGVWGAGNRIIVKRIRASGLDSAVFATNWTTGVTHAGRPVGWVIEDIEVDTVDFGVLAVSLDRPHIENIRGSYVRSTGSADPAHLVYVVGVAGADTVRGLTGGNWRAVDSTADPAFQLRHIDSGALGSLVARNCGGLLNYEGLKDFTIDKLVGTDDQKADETGSIGGLGGATETSERLIIKAAIVQKAVSGRAVLFSGTDCEIESLIVKANRSADNANGDVILDGTRNRVRSPRLRNAGSSTTGAEGIVVRGTATGLPATDCEIIDPEIRNGPTTPGNLNGIVVNAGAVRTGVRYDPAMVVPKAGSLKVNDAGTSTRVQTLATDDAWHEVGAAGEPAFAGTWVNFGTGNSTAAFKLIADGLVQLKGTIKTGTIATAAFTLPAGYRPPASSRFAVPSNNAYGQVDITSAGVVTPQVGNNTFVSLDGISFKAA